jgi:hypothetical protein
MKAWKITFYILAIIPLLFISPILIFYFHTAYHVGHLPTYGNPDPKYSDLYNIYSPIVNFSISLWIFSVLPWLALLLIHSSKKDKEHLLRIKGWGGIFYLIAFLLLFSVVFEWYVD